MIKTKFSADCIKSINYFILTIGVYLKLLDTQNIYDKCYNKIITEDSWRRQCVPKEPCSQMQYNIFSCFHEVYEIAYSFFSVDFKFNGLVAAPGRFVSAKDSVIR